MTLPQKITVTAVTFVSAVSGNDFAKYSAEIAV